jgi:carboxyl-terminal processing protease
LESAARGDVVGVGFRLAADTCGQRIAALHPRGPAERAGLQVGDCLSRVAGTDVAGLGAEELAALVAGPEGTELELTIVRGATPARRVLLLRSRLLVAMAHRREVQGTAVIRVEAVGDDLVDELQSLLAQEPPGALVLDLRGNPGGRLDQAIAVADLFLEGGTIVRAGGRAPGSERAWAATPGDALRGAPMLLLVDGGTASAAEVLAGALQEAGRARLVGRPTYGKSTVQSLYHYEDGSVLKLTEARWSLASGRSPTPGSGLSPDVLVAPPPADPRSRLQDHILRLEALSAAERSTLLAEVEALPREPAPPPAVDRDLEAALHLLGR